MDECPSCGARLAGDPSWCPRCLARFDRREVGAPAAAAFGARPTVGSSAPTAPTAPPAPSASPPPSMFTPYLAPTHAPAASPAPAASLASSEFGQPATAPPTKNRIPTTVVKAIGMGVVLQAVVWALVKGLHMEPAPAVAMGLGLTLAFYLLVLALVHSRLFDGAVKPVWHEGPPGTALVIGVTVGSALAFLIVGANSLIRGRLASDDAATVTFAQGGLVRVVCLVLIMVVAAPFIEELLFRGLLCESLRGRGKGAAIWISALAFALWHLRPDAIRYYMLCGALLGILYWKRGLVASMAAHATFNGTLALVAFLSISGPPQVINGAGLSLTAPKAWHQVKAPSGGSNLELRNPSGAAVFIQRQSIGNVDPNALIDRITTSSTLGNGVTVKANTAQNVELPIGSGARVDIVDNGREAEAVVVATSRGLVIAELATGGNANAQTDFDRMLQTLTLS